MGFIFRKSINIGGFRINLSKSGIGYSFGVPGFRYTKLANGNSKTTAYLPKTGIQYTTENSNFRKNYYKQINTIPGQYLTGTTEILPENYKPTQNENFIKSLHVYKYFQIFFKMCIIICCLISFENIYFSAFSFLFLVISIYWYLFKRINVDFIFEDDFAKNNYESFKLFFELLSNSSRIYECVETYHNDNIKYTSGAYTSITTNSINVRKTKPLFIKTNIHCFKIKTKSKNLIFLPNGLLIDTLFSLHFLDISDISINCSETIFIESFTPVDSECLGITWEYVNKNGGPDRRFNNNKRLYENNYGKIKFYIPNILNLSILFSNYKNIPDLKNLSNFGSLKK